MSTPLTLRAPVETSSMPSTRETSVATCSLRDCRENTSFGSTEPTEVPSGREITEKTLTDPAERISWTHCGVMPGPASDAIAVAKALLTPASTVGFEVRRA